jgi:hypothetical protein
VIILAKVRNPLQSSAAVGSVGGVVYSIHKSTNVARERVAPSNPQSARQLLVRAQHATSAQSWAGLSSGERAGWNVYAAAHPGTDPFGNPQPISGFNWYCACSDMLADIGLGLVHTAPAAAAPPSVAAFVPTGGAGQISCAFTAGAASLKINFWVYGPHSVGRTPKLENAKHNKYAAGETSPNVISGLSAGFYTVWARFVSETDGQVSPFVKATATVT